MEHGKFAKDYKPKIEGKRTYCLLGYKWKKRINKELEILEVKDILDFENIKIKKQLKL